MPNFDGITTGLRQTFLFGSLLISFLTLPLSILAAPGDLDRTFSGDGKLTDNFGFSYDNALRSVAIQQDGKIVVGGVGSGFTLARYNSDGSIDASFGTDGKVIDGREGNGVAIQTDGKIVVNARYSLARYNPNGSRDLTFGNGTGTVQLGLVANSIVIQPDGRIVVAGYFCPVGDHGCFYYYFALERFDTDGSPDATFDGDGLVLTVLNGDATAFAVAIQPDGKIVAAGVSGDQFAIVRYNSDGSLDTTFGTQIGSYAAAYSIAIQSDGKILAAGASYDGLSSDFAIARYDQKGSPDTTFDNDGIVTTPIGSGDDFLGSVAVQSDGKIVAAGSSYDGQISDFALARYNVDGSLDTAFGGGDGKTTVDFGNSNDIGGPMALDSAGRALVVGGSDGKFALARFQLLPGLPIISNTKPRPGL